MASVSNEHPTDGPCLLGGCSAYDKLSPYQASYGTGVVRIYSLRATHILPAICV